MRLFAQGKFTELVNAGILGSNDVRGAILVFMTAARNDDFADAATSESLFIEKLKGGVNERVYLYLWARMHDDLMWLSERSDTWKKFIASGLPWKTIFNRKTYQSEWNASVASLLSVWEPQRLTKYPKALQYMVNPSEQHVLAAACGKDNGYMNPAQIDAIRPGASQWFKMRKTLGIEETSDQANRAFRQWWKQGAVQGIDAFDPNVFETSI